MREAKRLMGRMGYWTGGVEAGSDSATRAAVIAFQKWERRTITGRLTTEELEVIRKSAAHQDGWPQPRDVGYAHVEVDLDRQVMMIVDNSRVRVLPVSTGSGRSFFEDGEESIAYTPRGRFVVYQKNVGWDPGAEGSIYYANYITGGVAIHGHPNVPIEPASHGCIRIPMFAARDVSKLLPLGTIVLVYDKVSFVSGREWVENPKLKRAAMLNSDHTDYTYVFDVGKTPAKKARLKTVRSD
jgi:lipoprotein-anchoring transpeptidase ErfK/SrfK